MSHLSQPGAIQMSSQWTKLFDSTLGADAGSIDSGAAGFSTALDQLSIWCFLRTTEAAVQSSATIRFNNDSGSNYDTQRISVVASTVSGNTSLAQTSMSVNVLGANAQAGAFSAVLLEIPAYAQTTGHKAVAMRNTAVEDTAADCVVEIKGGRWRSTNAISRVALTPGSGNFLAGSRMTVYGI